MLVDRVADRVQQRRGLFPGFSWPGELPKHWVMVRHVHDRSPRVQELLTHGGGTDHRALTPVGDLSRSGLAVLDRQLTVRPEDVAIGTDLVADLYDPSLVISRGYVGPDRRVSPRSSRPVPALGLLVRRTVLVAFLTAVVVAPLTLIVARSIPPAAAHPAMPQVQATPDSKAGPAKHSPHEAPTPGRQIARAEAAYRRALVRFGGSAGPATATGTMSHSSPTGARLVGGAHGSATPSIAVARQVRQSAAHSIGVEQRAAAQAQAAQQRAAAQAATAQRKAAAMAARAQAQAARGALRGGAPAGNAPVGT
jgi:hypothetical protein